MNSIHVALLCLLAPVQDAQTSARRTVPASDLVMEIYVPEHLDSGELQRLASDLAGSKYQASDPELGNRPMRSLRRFDETVLIYDTAERVRTLLTLLKKLDDIAAVEEAKRRTLEQAEADRHQQLDEALTTRQYRPKFLSLNDLSQAMIPYQQRYQERFDFVEDAGFMVFTVPDGVSRDVLSYLERVDVPAPQLEITCYLVRGRSAPAPIPAPEDLAKGLRQLIGYEHIQLEASSMLRTSAGAHGLSLRLDVDGPAYYELELVPAAFADEQGALTLDECTLLRGDTNAEIDDRTRVFRTETIVYCGEYTVLGATGSSPELVVIRCKRAGGPATPTKAGGGYTR